MRNAGLRQTGIDVASQRDVDEVPASVLEQIGVQSHAEQAVLPMALNDVSDRREPPTCALCRVDAHNSLSGPLRHPQTRRPGPERICQEFARPDTTTRVANRLRARHRSCLTGTASQEKKSSNRCRHRVLPLLSRERQYMRIQSVTMRHQ